MRLLEDYLPASIITPVTPNNGRELLLDEDNYLPNDPVPELNEPAAAKYKRKSGELKVAGRELIKDLKTGVEILAKLKELSPQIPESLQCLTDADRQWVLKVFRPISKCLENHFGGKEDEFLAKYGKDTSGHFATARFFKICKGDGASCA